MSNQYIKPTLPLKVATGIINSTHRSVESASSQANTASTASGLWSAQTQPTYDLDFSQFLTPEGGGYDFDVLFQNVLSANLGAGGPAGPSHDIMFPPLNVPTYSAPLAQPNASGDYPSPEVETEPGGNWACSNMHSVPSPMEPFPFVEPKQDRASGSEDNDGEIVTLMRNELTHLIKTDVKRPTSTPRNHPCPTCGRNFTRRFNMLTHLKTHDKTRYFLRKSLTFIDLGHTPASFAKSVFTA
jgi:hypothetical protein